MRSGGELRAYFLIISSQILFFLHLSLQRQVLKKML